MADKNPYSVSVVLDRCFGDRLIALAQDGPVWIIDSAQNREIANICWSRNPVPDHLVGITLFKGLDTTSPEDLLIGNLGTIDLHHGEYSAPIPYSILEIIGASRTPKVEAKLAEYGFDQLENTSGGFRAVQTSSEAKKMEMENFLTMDSSGKMEKTQIPFGNDK